jgi:hypothetical protein
MNNNTKQNWLDFSYDFSNKILTKESINISLNKFYKEKLSNIKDNIFIYIQFKVITEDNIYWSISYIQTIKIREFKFLYDLFNEFWDIKTNDYKTLSLKSIVFTYKILSLEESKKIKSKIVRHLDIKIKSQKDILSFGGYDLPTTMDFTNWGLTYFNEDYSSAIVLKSKSKIIYHINLYENYHEVELKVNDIIMLKFIDYRDSNCELNSFTRIINKNHEYIFENGILKIKKIIKKVSFWNLLNLV